MGAPLHHPRFNVDAESDDPEEQSSVTKLQVAKHIVAEKNWTVMLTTCIQMAWAGWVQAVCFGMITTALPIAFGLTTVTPALVVLQGLLVLVSCVMCKRISQHYDADMMIMVLRLFMPLISLDMRMDYFFRRKHRGHDLFWAWGSTLPMMAALFGGWVAGEAVVGYFNGTYSNVGNPYIYYAGFGEFDTRDVQIMVAVAFTLVYLGASGHRIMTDSGHLRHWIEVLKEEETPEARIWDFEYAIMCSLLFMWNVALTGSPIKFEMIIAEMALSQVTAGRGLWIAAQFGGLGMAIVLLFFYHHIGAHYNKIARHEHVPKDVMLMLNR